MQGKDVRREETRKCVIMTFPLTVVFSNVFYMFVKIYYILLYILYFFLCSHLTDHIVEMFFSSHWMHMSKRFLMSLAFLVG